ncbi:MAG: DUF5719 family protein [Actinomycetota bacterium]
MIAFARRFGLIALAGAGLTTALLVPTTPAPVEVSLPAVGAPPYVVCPAALSGGGFTTRLGLFSETDTTGHLTAVATSDVPFTFEIGANGSTQVGVEDLAELGVTPIMVEPGAIGAATLARAGGQAGLAGCGAASRESVGVLGLATGQGERSSLILVNPFAVEATVRLAGTSEFGPDTPTELELIRVPPNSKIEVVLDEQMPGRESLSFSVDAETGAVIAAMYRSGPNDVATSGAIAGATEWFLALPDFGSDGNLTIRSLSEIDTTFRIDRFDASGAIEDAGAGQLGPSGPVRYDLSELAEAGEGLILAATEPVAAAVTYTGDVLRIVSPAASTTAGRWAIPVSALASEGQTAIWIFNPFETTSAIVASLAGRVERTIDLPAGTTVGSLFSLPDGAGAIVTARAPVAVFYGVLSGSTAAMNPAVPLE